MVGLKVLLFLAVRQKKGPDHPFNVELWLAVERHHVKSGVSDRN